MQCSGLMNREPVFKCKECGNSGLYREERYDWFQPLVGSLECRCGKTNDDAAIRTYKLTTRRIEANELVDCHYFGRRIADEEVNKTIDDLFEEVQCEYCLENAKEEDWIDRPEEPNDIHGPYADNLEVYVRCAGCGREIEFGWDNPPSPLANILGVERCWVYPVECSDFDPTHCWPDNKYKERWIERGWHGKARDERQ